MVDRLRERLARRLDGLATRIRPKPKEHDFKAKVNLWNTPFCDAGARSLK